MMNREEYTKISIMIVEAEHKIMEENNISLADFISLKIVYLANSIKSYCEMYNLDYNKFMEEVVIKNIKGE